jgi:hypothetical protein
MGRYKMQKYENIPRQIRNIADHAMKRCYVRYNPKDEILNFYQRRINKFIKKGIVRRIRIDRKNAKFIDVDNKCEVHIWDCGYLLATKLLYMKTGIPTYWKKADKKCTCKTRFVFYVSELDDLFDPDPAKWIVLKQCEVKKDGKWKIVPHDVPISNIVVSDEERNNTIREMYSVYGVPPKVLANMFKLSERWTQKLVQDLKEQYKKVKKSRGLKKVGFEYFED